MILRCLSYTLLLFSLTCFAQGNQNLQFTGKLISSSFHSISYKINISVHQNGSFNGISTFDALVEKPESYKLFGIFNLEDSKVSFSEYIPVSKQSLLDRNNTCFINVSNADISIENQKVVINGSFEAKNNQGKVCYVGKLNLIGPKLEDLNWILGSEEQYAFEFNIEDINKLETTTLTKDKLFNIYTPEKIKYVKIYLWDEEVEDGDVLDIISNGRLIQENIEIKNSEKSFEIPIYKRETLIEIRAKNTGRIFPNTVSILIIDKKEVYKLQTKLKKDESTFIEIYSTED